MGSAHATAGGPAPATTPTPGVQIRRLEPGERETIVEVLKALSARSRYMRFLSPLPQIPRSLVDELAAVDDRDHIALVAFVTDRPIGEARFVRAKTCPDTADLAVAVADEHQGRGVARNLCAALARYARGVGIARFSFDVSAENGAALTPLRRRGARSSVSGGIISGEIDVSCFETGPPDASVDQP